jgi:hypothetical protein
MIAADCPEASLSFEVTEAGAAVTALAGAIACFQISALKRMLAK